MYKQKMYIMENVETINQTLIRFPEIALATRDAHKLRGFFGDLFREHSPLLHNHFEDGSLRYAYPLVQYKVIDGVPMLVGFGEGSRLLIELFIKITGFLSFDFTQKPNQSATVVTDNLFCFQRTSSFY